MTTANAAMLEQIKSGQGFIAALDQSGGSTPKALKGYGIEADAFSNDEEMFGLIGQLNRQGLAILLVEQNARQALAFATRGFVLASGQNRFTGTGPELIADPEVAKSFLGG